MHPSMQSAEFTVARELPSLVATIAGRSVNQDMAEKGVIIVGPDKKHSEALRSVLESADYEPLLVGSLSDARANLETKRYGALLIDLDHTFLDNRLLKELRQAHPGVCLIGLSNRSFHPELEEALSRYIDACFSESADYEELLYWLKAVFDPPSRQESKTQCTRDDSGQEQAPA